MEALGGKRVSIVSVYLSRVSPVSVVYYIVWSNIFDEE